MSRRDSASATSRGAGDAIPEALRQLGIEPVLLDEAALAEGNLNSFDVILTGIRAYEVRPDLVANNQRLLDYVQNGGTLIVQYNKYEFPEGNFAPYPVSMSRPHDRVTDESAPVRLLDRSHPVLSMPNRITEQDWEGWVQERGLYFLNTWDPQFTPLLEMADPGEEPLRGALLVAPYGEGTYVYTGLSLFRQLPEGVPGGLPAAREPGGAGGRHEVRECESAKVRECDWNPQTLSHSRTQHFRTGGVVGMYGRRRPHPVGRLLPPRPPTCCALSRNALKPPTPMSTCSGSTWARRRCWTAYAPSGRTRRPMSGSARPPSSSRAPPKTDCCSRTSPPGQRAVAEHSDTAGFYQGVYLTPEVIAFNSEALSADEAPRDWDEVLDPRWTDEVLIRDPLASGTMRTIFGMILARSIRETGSPEAGWEWLRRLDAQTKEYVLNPTLLYQKLARQEGLVTLWTMPDIELLKATTDYPIDYVFPTSGTPLVVDAVAVVEGTPHPELAREFVDFVGSEEAVLLAAREFFRLPARQDIPADSLPANLRRAREQIRPEPIDWELLQERGAEWMRQWDEQVRGRG